MTSLYEYDYIEKLTSDYHGKRRVSPPTIYQNGIMFLSDGTSGYILDHLYIITQSGVLDLSAAASGSITAGANVGGYEQVYKGVNGSLLEFRTLRAGAGVTITPSTDYLTISASSSSGYETVLSSSGTIINPTLGNTELVVNSAGVRVVSMANHTVPGFQKAIFLSQVSAVGSFQVNLNIFGGTSILFDTTTQGVLLVWTSLNKWTLISGGAVLI